MPFVYLLRCGDGTLYAGAAVALERRLAEHAAGKGSRYTRSRLPVKLVWSVEVESWSEALKEEHRIKSLRRAEKLALIAVGGEPKHAPRTDRRRERSARAAPGSRAQVRSDPIGTGG